MASNRILTKELRQQIKQLASEGVSFPEIADRLQCSIHIVRRAANLPSQLQKGRKERRETILALINQGLTPMQVAKELRVSRSTVGSYYTATETY